MMPTNKARNSTYDGSFAEGRAAGVHGNKTGAGGSNLKDGYKTTPGGDALNKGRLNGGTEKSFDLTPASGLGSVKAHNTSGSQDHI